MIFNVHTTPCVGCGTSTTFTMTEEQFNRFRTGEHVQRIFPDWSSEDRELLISGTCPSCWEEMWAEEEDDGYDAWDESTHEEDCECAICDSYNMGPLDPESDDSSYDSDYYVDQDCD